MALRHDCGVCLRLRQAIDVKSKPAIILSFTSKCASLPM